MAVSGVSLALAQSAAAPRLATPIFSQLVVFSLPPEFKSTKPTYEKDSGSFYLRQQVPDGETAAKWSRMITISGTRGLAANSEATPQRLLGRMTPSAPTRRGNRKSMATTPTRSSSAVATCRPTSRYTGSRQ
jgi:hypothetical protein